MKRKPTPPCKCSCTCPKPPPGDPPHLARLLALGRRKLDSSPGTAWSELIGAPDEVDEFFRLESRDASAVLVLRVQGRPDRGQAWVH